MLGDFGEVLVVDWGIAKAFLVIQIGAQRTALCPQAALSHRYIRDLVR